MAYYRDPTADRALGNINREFSRLEKKAKTLRKLYEEGKLSESALRKSQAQFTGLYKHVLSNVLEEKHEPQTPPE